MNEQKTLDYAPVSYTHLDVYKRQPYYNPDAVPFCLEQPLTMPGEETFRQRKLGEKNPLLRLQPGYESAQTFTKIYEAALNRALQEMEDWKLGDDLQPLLVRLAEHLSLIHIYSNHTG